MRESLLDKQVDGARPRRRWCACCPTRTCVKVGGRSIIDGGRDASTRWSRRWPALPRHKLIIGTGGGVRSRHVFSIGIDLGLPTGVLAQLALADALGNAHILGTLLAPHGVVAIPPEIFGHLLPLFMQARRASSSTAIRPTRCGSIRRRVGRIPPHRTDAGTYLLAECFGCATLTLIKDVDGLYDGIRRSTRMPASSMRSRSPSCGSGTCQRCPSIAP